MPQFLPGQTLPAGKLQQLGGLIDTYTPTLTASSTNPSLGSGATAAGIWSQQGDWARVMFHLQFGSSGASAGSGTYRISLPSGMDANLSMSRMVVGAGRVQDASDPTSTGVRLVTVELITATDVQLAVEGGRLVTDSSPWTWAASDELMASFDYPLA